MSPALRTAARRSVQQAAHRERREHTVLEVDGAPGLVHGDVDEGYGAVADACRRNVAERGGIGAAGVVHRNGREVVDL